ncbi:hypothetical protein D3C72_1807910 [compost metagenome]
MAQFLDKAAAVEADVRRQADDHPQQQRQRQVVQQVVQRTVAPAHDREPAALERQPVLAGDDVHQRADRHCAGGDQRYQPVGEAAAQVGDQRGDADRQHGAQQQNAAGEQ